MTYRPVTFVLLLGLAGCGKATPSTGFDLGVDLITEQGPPPPDAARMIVDEDGDGLDDGDELRWAKDYLPFISTAPGDGCKVGGLLVRVTPNPDDAHMVHIIYDYLYDIDCGLGGHPGDDEVFAITADLTVPAPEGIRAMRAISHQNTPCQRDSVCGSCGGLQPCQTLTKDGKAWPAIWPSKDKHGGYVNRASACTLVGTCLDQCDDATTPTVPEIVNAGEPGMPLVSDLTDHGFVTSANGWTNMELFHFDPWKTGAKFGGAGVVALDLIDPAFNTPACRP
jgi:hypothetical protein